MMDSGQPGPRTRVSFDDWVMVAPPPPGSALSSSDPTLESDGRDPSALLPGDDEEDAVAMRMGRLRLRAEASFNVDALLRQGGGACLP